MAYCSASLPFQDRADNAVNKNTNTGALQMNVDSSSCLSVGCLYVKYLRSCVRACVCVFHSFARFELLYGRKRWADGYPFFSSSQIGIGMMDSRTGCVAKCRCDGEGLAV